MDAMRVRCRSMKSICLAFQDIQHRAVYGNRNACLGFQGVDSGQMGNRNNLPCSMCMVFIGRGMRMHNHYPVHNVNMGKHRYTCLIR